MINAKNLIKLARKWQRVAALRRQRIMLPQTVKTANDKSSCSTLPMVEKGHFVVYSVDKKRFLLPLEYLYNEITTELFNMAEEFDLPSKGPLTLPCQAELIEYAITLINRKVTRDVEGALLTSIASNCGSLPFRLQHQASSYQPICSF